MRDHQAVNRRTLADDMTVLTMIIIMIMMMVTITADMSHIAIAIMTDDDMTPARKAITEEEHADLVNRAIRPTGQDIQDTDRGQVPCTGIRSRRPALIGPTHVPVHQDSHPVTTRDLTNLIATSSNTTQEEDTMNHPTINSTINTHTSLTVHMANHFTNTGSGTISPDGYNNPTEVG